MITKVVESIAKNELYMGYIFGIMILGGFIRDYSALEDVYALAKTVSYTHLTLPTILRV